MKPFKQKSPVVTAIKKKNIVTVGDLKKKVSSLEDDNIQMEGMLKSMAPGETDSDLLKKVSANNEAIGRYKKIIANPSKFKPKAVVKTTIIKKAK